MINDMKITEEKFKEALKIVNTYKLQNNKIKKEITEESFVHETNLSVRGKISLLYFCWSKPELQEKYTNTWRKEQNIANMQLKELKGYSKKDFLSCRGIGIARLTEIEEILLQAGILIRDDLSNQSKKINKLKFEDFELSNRLLNCLKAMDLIYLEQLKKIRRSDIKKYRNFGAKSQSELIDFMEDSGLKFLGQ
jgi:DNA-directed RNA polymerase alpha subunit